MTSTYSFAVPRSFRRNLQFIDQKILNDLCKTPGKWLQNAIRLNDLCRAIQINDSDALIIKESHGYLIIVDICSYDDCMQPYKTWDYSSNDTADFITLSEFLGYDLFWHYNDEALHKIGVPCDQNLMRALRKIHKQAELNDLIDTEMLDDDTAEVLIQLSRSGYKTAGLCHGEILDEMPIEKWRYFLHPLQVKYASSQYDGPFLLTGGAGTGKTLVAMHRAVELACKLSGKQNLLFTTFGKTLTTDLQHNVSELCKSKNCTDALEHIEIIAIDDWTDAYLKAHIGPQVHILYKKNDILNIWNHSLNAFPEIRRNFTSEFFFHEWHRVIITEKCKSLQDYLNAKQNQSCQPLAAQQREFIWPVFQKYIQFMNDNHEYDIHYAQLICESILSAQNAPLYPHIIADECQDLSISALRLLRAIAGPQHANDIFLCGDKSQRIFATRGHLLECGIDTTNRTDTLHLNYRTPLANHQYALRFLPAHIPSEEDAADSYCVPRGSEPERKSFHSIEEEGEFVCQKILELTQTGRKKHLQNICLVHRKNSPIETYCNILQKHGIPFYRIDNNSPFNDPQIPGVRITTMHRVKGLEFDDIFILGATEENLSCALHYIIYDDDRRDSEDIESCLLYVAVTRARHKAWITSNSPEFSHLIPQAQHHASTL